jgi:hypothetical protein
MHAAEAPIAVWTTRTHMRAVNYKFVDPTRQQTIKVHPAPGGPKTELALSVTTAAQRRHPRRIFSQSHLLLVTHRENSLSLIFYWSPTENILSVSSSTGYPQRIFSQSRLLLVTHREHSLSLILYWSPTENILSVSSSIGHPQRIFSQSHLLLVTHR